MLWYGDTVTLWCCDTVMWYCDFILWCRDVVIRRYCDVVMLWYCDMMLWSYTVMLWCCDTEILWCSDVVILWYDVVMLYCDVVILWYDVVILYCDVAILRYCEVVLWYCVYRLCMHLVCEEVLFRTSYKLNLEVGKSQISRLRPFTVAHLNTAVSTPTNWNEIMWLPASKCYCANGSQHSQTVLH